MKQLRKQMTARRGFTLVELMIVVAIIGVLAAVAGVAYMKYIKSAKIGKLKQYAMEIANAQEQYKSQNSRYLGEAGSPITYDETATSPKFKQLLGFDKKGLAAQDITVTTEAGGKDDDCTICGSDSPDFDTVWYAVEVTQDLNPDSAKKTTVRLYTGLPSPMLLNEGE